LAAGCFEALGEVLDRFLTGGIIHGHRGDALDAAAVEPRSHRMRKLPKGVRDPENEGVAPVPGQFIDRCGWDDERRAAVNADPMQHGRDIRAHGANDEINLVGGDEFARDLAADFRVELIVAFQDLDTPAAELTPTLLENEFNSVGDAFAEF